MAGEQAWLWVALVGLVLAGCGGGGDGPGELGGAKAPWAGAQGATEQGGSAKASGPGGVSKPEPEPVIRRLGPGERCDLGFGVCDVGLTCVDGVCCTSKCDGTCERCDLELVPSEVGEEPRYSGNCALDEDCSECVRYVGGKVPVLGDGESWATAFQTVQEGIDAAHAAVQADTELDSCDVWVARGTYYIYVDDPLNTVQLEPGAELYGGFVGTETERAERDWQSNVTALSGYDGPGGENRVFHVVTGSDDAVLDGLTVTGGLANGSDPHDKGGGMYNDASSPTVANCTFSGNDAYFGGGMHNHDYSSPTLTSCTFSGNSASWGGGMYNYDYSSPTLTSCMFSGNSTNENGGGMCNGGHSAPTLTGCTFSGNSADDYGGGMYNCTYSAPTLTDCTFSGNSARVGGGMANSDYGSSTLTGCAFSGNDAGWRGGMFCKCSSPKKTSCTF